MFVKIVIIIMCVALGLMPLSWVVVRIIRQYNPNSRFQDEAYRKKFINIFIRMCFVLFGFALIALIQYWTRYAIWQN